LADADVCSSFDSLDAVVATPEELLTSVVVTEVSGGLSNRFAVTAGLVLVLAGTINACIVFVPEYGGGGMNGDVGPPFVVVDDDVERATGAVLFVVAPGVKYVGAAVCVCVGIPYPMPVYMGPEAGAAAGDAIV
jgi:hypothetical protein